MIPVLAVGWRIVRGVADDDWTYRRIIRFFDELTATLLAPPEPFTEKADDDARP